MTILLWIIGGITLGFAVLLGVCLIRLWRVMQALERAATGTHPCDKPGRPSAAQPEPQRTGGPDSTSTSPSGGWPMPQAENHDDGWNVS